jgi:hypothetical protein
MHRLALQAVDARRFTARGRYKALHFEKISCVAIYFALDQVLHSASSFRALIKCGLVLAKPKLVNSAATIQQRS